MFSHFEQNISSLNKNINTNCDKVLSHTKNISELNEKSITKTKDMTKAFKFITDYLKQDESYEINMPIVINDEKFIKKSNTEVKESLAAITVSTKLIKSENNTVYKTLTIHGKKIQVLIKMILFLFIVFDTISIFTHYILLRKTSRKYYRIFFFPLSLEAITFYKEHAKEQSNSVLLENKIDELTLEIKKSKKTTKKKTVKKKTAKKKSESK